MNGIHRNGRNCDFEKTYPGCLGRMVSLFELNVEASANRLLNDKPHQNGFPLSRSRSDVSRMIPSVDPIEERVIVPEFKKSILDVKSNGTPMKMLIAQEMSKEDDPRQDPPNLVAKLMGLDAFPHHEPDSTLLKSPTRDHPRTHSCVPMRYCEQENGFFHYIDPNKYEDVSEICEQSLKSPHVARYEDNIIERKMTLVRQKFIEAKRLSMNEELRQSKQFQDALEVLSSNRDLFLDCLQEPGTMFSENVYSRQSDPHPHGTKRITVLRPSKMAASSDFPRDGNKDGKPKKKEDFLQVSDLHKVHPGSSPPASLEYYENSIHPTRIVVLKPSSGKARDVKAVGSLYSELPRMLQRGDYLGDIRYNENQGSREAAKAITQKVRKELDRHCRDETLISSMLCNSYAGDESSFNESELEYADDNLSDLEASSSWDYVNRLSPYSSSSLTRASYFSESSVCREAKKRLSERWAMMASNGVCQEQRRFQSSSSTLGEMLALSETKAETSHADESNSSQEPKILDTLLVGGHRTEANMDNSPRNLLRSKSLPVSTSESEGGNVSISILDKSKSQKENTKARTAKSTFKGKVTSLFFSRNKKPGNDKSLVVDSKDEYFLPLGETCPGRSDSLSDKGSTNASPLFEPSSKASSSNRVCKQGLISLKTGLFVDRAIAFVNPGENQDHPSPVSVLDPPYEVDDHTEKVFPHHLKLDQQGVEPPLNCIGSHLIDKSPPIGSISRSLSWDGSCVSSHPQKKSSTSETEQEQEWFNVVKSLLSAQGEGQSNSYSGRWYTPESPLHPSLRDKYIDIKDKKTQHDAKQKLVFDCVNEVLVEIAGCDERAIPCVGAHDFVTKKTSSTTLLDEVWGRMKVWFSGVSDDCVDNSSPVMERMVRKEVVGPGWSRQFSLELFNLGKAIERRLLEELVLEVVAEFTGTI